LKSGDVLFGGLRIHSIDGDGDCIFAALAYWLRVKLHWEWATAAALRAYFNQAVNSRWGEFCNGYLSNTVTKEHLTRFAVQGEWDGSEEIKELCDLVPIVLGGGLGLDIEITHADFHTTLISGREVSGAAPDVNNPFPLVKLYYSGDHYDVVEESGVHPMDDSDKAGYVKQKLDKIEKLVTQRGVKRKTTLSESGADDAFHQLKTRLQMKENDSKLLSEIATGLGKIPGFKWLAVTGKNSKIEVGEAPQKDDYAGYISALSGLPVYDEDLHDEFCSKHSKDDDTLCLMLGDRGTGATTVVSTTALPIDISGRPDVLVLPISAVKSRAIKRNVLLYADIKRPGRISLAQTKLTLLGGNCNSESLPIALQTDLNKELHLFWLSRSAQGELVLNQSSLNGELVPAALRAVLRKLQSHELLKNERISLPNAIQFATLEPVLEQSNRKKKKKEKKEDKSEEDARQGSESVLLAHLVDDPRYAHLPKAKIEASQRKELLEEVARTLFLRLPSVRNEPLPRECFHFYG
jgi:hypothetical protein